MAHEILVIDENKLTRWSLATLLTRCGYTVREATTAADGCACAKEAAPDLVLVDLCLLDMAGSAAMQRLRQRCPGLPVVVMSADATADTVRSVSHLGASGFLAKPCAAVLLQTLVAYLLL